MKNLKNKSVLKKLSYIGLIIVVIAFFAIPSFIFAEGEDSVISETTQTASTEQTQVEDATQETTTETVTTETATTGQGAAETLASTETQSNESTNVVNTEVVYSPLISTDKADYNPGETVTVFGTGFKPGDEVEFAGLVIADEEGNFIYTYAIKNHL